MAQQVKCVSCKHGDVSSVSRTHSYKKATCGGLCLESPHWEYRHRQIPLGQIIGQFRQFGKLLLNTRDPISNSKVKSNPGRLHTRAFITITGKKHRQEPLKTLRINNLCDKTVRFVGVPRTFLNSHFLANFHVLEINTAGHIRKWPGLFGSSFVL